MDRLDFLSYREAAEVVEVQRLTLARLELRARVASVDFREVVEVVEPLAWTQPE